MKTIQKNESGFSAVEALLIIVILGIVGFAGWFVYNSHKQTNATLQAASQDSSNIPIPKSTKSSSSSSENSNNTTVSTKYLKITQLGIEIPLNSNLNGLSYYWDGNQAWILSPAVTKYANQIDPSNCSSNPSGLSAANNSGGQSYQEIGLLYKGTAGSSNQQSKVTINGVSYTLRRASSGCTSNQKVITMVSTYEKYLNSQLAKAQAIQ